MIGKLYKYLSEIAGNISHDEITVYSAQASYYIAFSSFPFIMLLLSLTGFFMPDYRSIVITNIQSLVPVSIQPSLTALTNELFEKSVSIVSLSAITTLWSASRGIAAVERGVRRVYRVTKRKNFFVTTFYSMIYTILFIFILLLTLLLQVFGNIVLDFSRNYIDLSHSEIIVIRTILFFVFVSMMFLFMYYFFSDKKIPLKMHLPGALATTAGWMLFSMLYSVYIDNFANYSYIYGSIAGIVLMMLWLFCCVVILLAGAEINKFFILRKGYRYE